MLLGELAALGTAACWSWTAVFFTEAGKRIGSYRLNKIRLVMAVCFYAIIMFVMTGLPYPTTVSWEQAGWLAISAIIGLIIGDGAGFRSLVILGPRLATLVMSTSPIFATIIAWIFLHEKLGMMELLGMAMTIGGVMWVVAERREHGHKLDDDHPDSGSKKLGVLLAIVAAASQAIGLIFSKHAMNDVGESLDPFPASMTRLLVASSFIWVMAAFKGEIPTTVKSMKNRVAMLFALGGAFFGPLLGIWTSLIAVKLIPTGVASTLNSTAPILMIPVVRLVYKEKPTVRSLAGTILAFAGVVLLFWN